VATQTHRPRGQARREALLEAVLAIVARTGADAVTHRKVAEVAGLPLASTTYWFSSKEDLLAAALEFAAERDIAELNERARELTHAADRVEAVAELIFGSLMAGPEQRRASRGSLTAAYALWLEGARRPRLRAVAQNWTDSYRRATADLLSRAGSSDPEAHAQLLVAAADGLLVEQLASGGDGDLAPPLRQLAAALLGQP
jgi:TetR/AcrR family transcriptional regulator, regulator of biofilm formation and stress response